MIFFSLLLVIIFEKKNFFLLSNYLPYKKVEERAGKFPICNFRFPMYHLSMFKKKKKNLEKKMRKKNEKKQ